MKRLPSLLALLVAVACIAGVPVSARASEWTSVMSTADDTDPFDGGLSLRWDWQLRKSLITREFVCSNIPGLCAGENRTVMLNEADASRTQNILNIDARIGLYHDLEVFATIPIVIGDQTDLTFPTGVDGSNSTLMPTGKPTLFNMPNSGRKRSGLGDVSVGLRYAPLAQWRDRHYPTLQLAFTYTMPSGTLRRADNSGVSSGHHQLRFDIIGSRRIAFIEPYVGLFGSLRLPASSTLFQNYGSTQNRTNPSPDLGLVLGTEFFPWDDARPDGKKGRYFSLDLGFSALYTFQGRNYTDLFEALGASACGTSLDPQCTLTTYTRTLENDASPAIRRMDGITETAPFGTFSTWAGFNLQPIEYVKLSFRFTYSRETAHHLTYADVGQDLDGSIPGGEPGVNYTNSLRQNEYNPVYVSEIDDPGKRLKSEGANIFGIMLMLTGKY